MVRKSHRSSFKFYTLTCMNIIYIYIIHNTTSSNKHTHKNMVFIGELLEMVEYIEVLILIS